MPKAPIEVTVGQRCNVRRAIHGEPLIRVVTKVEWREESDGLWFYWYWQPEARADGGRDCGYSGIRVCANDTRCIECGKPVEPFVLACNECLTSVEAAA